jgi:Spy/CpxP family protein refolding chaperone
MVYATRVQAKLGLTQQQKQQVEGIRRQGVAYVGKINRKFEEGKISQQQRLQLLRSRRTSQGAEILQVLTPEQRNTVLALEGKKLAS